MAYPRYQHIREDRIAPIPPAFLREGDVPPPPPSDPHYREWFSTEDPDLSWLKYGAAGMLCLGALLTLLQIALLFAA